MKQKRRTISLIWRIFMGIFCFLLLAVLLYFTQFVSSFFQQHSNALTELTHVRNEMASYLHQNETEQLWDELYKQYLQKASLRLANTEISNEDLAVTVESEPLVESIVVFAEDGTLLHSYGTPMEDPSFLSELYNSGIVNAKNGLSYMAIRLYEDQYLAIGMDSSLLQFNVQKADKITAVASELAPGMTGELVVSHRATGKVIYGPDNMIGKKTTDFFWTPTDNNLSLSLMIVDNAVICVSFLRFENYLLMSLYDFSSLVVRMHSTVIPALAGFSFLIFLLLAYTEFIRTDMCRGRLGKIHYVQFGKKRYLNTLLLRKLVGFALIGIACIMCSVYCLQLLVRSDIQRQHADDRLDIAARMLEESQATLAELEELDLAVLTENAQEIKSMIAANPNLLSTEGLNSLTRLFSLNSIYLLDENGKTFITNADDSSYSLSSDPNDPTYVFWDIINGLTESRVQFVPQDPHNQGFDMLYTGISTQDGHGVILFTVAGSFNTLHQTYSVENVLKTVGLDSQSTLLAIDSGSSLCVFDSSNQFVGLALNEYGIEDAYLRNGYSGTHEFDGQDCLIATRSVLDWTLLYITPTSWISTNSWIFTVLVILIGLLVVTMAVLPRIVVHTPGEDIRMPAQHAHAPSHRSHVDAIIDRNGQLELVENRIEHHTLRKRWMTMNASAKLSWLVHILLGVLGGFVSFYLLFFRHVGNHPLTDRILSQNWDKALNVYAFSYVVIAVTGIWVAAGILQNITLFVTGTFSRRWKTTGVLLSNIIRYTALISSIFFSLKNFGVETSTLVTSASVLTLIFGLGCQNFVADLVAGIFLIFEGTFRVGDIVTIDNWHGEVVELGLRSTKVKNEIGNVKVFQNSRISGAVNMTRDQTFAVCDLGLPAGIALETYEQMLTDSFFPSAMESIQLLRHPLVYEGVVAMNGDNATLRISVKCLEHEREQIKRELFRALKLWREEVTKNPPANK